MLTATAFALQTCNFDALFAYLTCGNYDFRYDLQKGLRPKRSIRTAMAHEIMFYGIGASSHSTQFFSSPF